MGAEVLPTGVGRVPKWWMEITPHYTLDEEDAEARRLAEDQMAFYYMQLAAADEAGVLNPDGSPKLGPDLQPLSWIPLTPWNGRAAAGDDVSGSTSGPGGRNFKPGHPVLDPRLFGVLESDPDYKAYLTGAKLPPGYFEKMGELANSDEGGTEGILNNLKQTDYGRYGRQAEKPAFKPAWAKKKLRGTETGANIRQGQYNDSPNKHINRRRVQTANVPAIELENSFSDTPYQEEVTKETMVRQVHAVQRTNVEQPESQEPKRYEHSDYYHNAPMLTEKQQKLKEQQEKLKRLQELQQQQLRLKEQKEKQEKLQQLQMLQQKQQELQQAKARTQGQVQEEQQRQQQEKLQKLQALQRKQQELKQAQMQAQKQVPEQAPEQAPVHASFEDEDESYEEEIIEDDYTEGSYEEEIIEDDDDEDLNDLQAILAAKQAELQRLQGQLA